LLPIPTHLSPSRVIFLAAAAKLSTSSQVENYSSV
jgi:hypothetical protein